MVSNGRNMQHLLAWLIKSAVVHGESLSASIYCWQKQNLWGEKVCLASRVTSGHRTIIPLSANVGTDSASALNVCWYRQECCCWLLSATRHTPQKGRDVLETVLPDCSTMCLRYKAEVVLSTQRRHRTKRGSFPALVKSASSWKANWTWRTVRHFLVTFTSKTKCLRNCIV